MSGTMPGDPAIWLVSLLGDIRQYPCDTSKNLEGELEMYWFFTEVDFNKLVSIKKICGNSTSF